MATGHTIQLASKARNSRPAANHTHAPKSIANTTVAKDSALFHRRSSHVAEAPRNTTTTHHQPLAPAPAASPVGALVVPASVTSQSIARPITRSAPRVMSARAFARLSATVSCLLFSSRYTREISSRTIWGIRALAARASRAKVNWGRAAPAASLLARHQIATHVTRTNSAERFAIRFEGQLSFDRSRPRASSSTSRAPTRAANIPANHLLLSRVPEAITMVNGPRTTRNTVTQSHAMRANPCNALSVARR